jgi:hypothetical protein
MPRRLLAVLTAVAVAVVAAASSDARVERRTTETQATADASVAGRRILVAGKPFFPVMLIEQCNTRALAAVRRLGINLVLNGGCTGLPGLRQLAAIDGDAYAALPIGRARVRGRALAGWTYPDEPEGNGWSSARLRKTFAYRRGSADGLLSFITTGGGFFSRPYARPNPPRAEYRALARVADVAGFDLYPLGHCSKDLVAVYDAQREFVRLAGGSPTFQWIETGPVRPTYCGGFRMKPQELRAEVFLAIAGGARGIGYFTHTWTPKHRAFDVDGAIERELRRTNATLEALTPALLGKTRESDADSHAIKLVARRAGNHTYVLAVNSLRQHVRAQLHVPSVATGRIGVFGERRSLTVGHDRFSDTFAPLAVHVYVQ